MKIIFYMLFMIPLGFSKKFWLNQYSYFLFFFLVILNYSFNLWFSNLSFMFGMDLLSFLMMILSIWICSLMLMASFKIKKFDNYYKLFNFTVLLMLMSLILTFSTMDFFMFYIFFEVSLIPTILLILGWGYQPERLQAGIYLMFYTLLGSLPLLVCLIYYYNLYNSLFFLNLVYWKNQYMYMFMLIVFLVKLPLFMLHLWLPKAHVEAPVSGSMILAGVMLKLGGYGILRLMLIFKNFSLNIMLINFSLIGSLIISLICLRQVDMKSLIAYSSVSHMGLMLSGMLTLNYWGILGGLVMMIAHGLCSSGLFCLANISYERLLSRSLFLNKGMLNLMPSMSMFWFMFSICNMAAPPSLNLMGEIILINSLVSYNFILMFSLMIMSFLSAGYSLYLYSMVQHGVLNLSLFSFNLEICREYLLLMLHLMPLNLMFLIGDKIMLFM
uniref:NADH-ubiquinone oxidoreductase chain 4 n=1 Tax=Leiodidae sp. BMNH 1274324 TaxID=1796521 RepID=A0A126TE18_9COLE|nr:NADH dehydrogenase subunit 4 [Leiodidae sp. BMNH 1274324]